MSTVTPVQDFDRDASLEVLDDIDEMPLKSCIDKQGALLQQKDAWSVVPEPITPNPAGMTIASGSAGYVVTNAAPRSKPKLQNRASSLKFLLETEYTGGEGVLLMNADGGAYWSKTLLAYSGRPVPVIPLLAFTVYFVIATTVSYWVNEFVYDGREVVQVDSKVQALLGTALFFLMVFRTNASYSRWWEARCHWGMMINRTRDFARQATAYIQEEQHVEKLIRYTIAFAMTTKRHLRFERDLDEVLDNGVLTYAQVEEIQAAKHMPNFILEVLARTLDSAYKDGHLSDYQTMTLDKNLTQYEDDLGACEKILKTKLPFALIVHLRTFLVLWLIVLPFSLVSVLGWGTFVASTITAYALLGIESIGVEIENPFGHDFSDLPLDDITNNTICKNLMEILERHKVWLKSTKATHGQKSD